MDPRGTILSNRVHTHPDDRDSQRFSSQVLNIQGRRLGIFSLF